MNDFVDTTMRNLDPRAVQAWFVLYRDTKPNGLAQTGLTDLATRMGCSMSTAKRMIRSLKGHGLVTTVRKGAPGCGPNAYRVTGLTPAEPPAPLPIQDPAAAGAHPAMRAQSFDP
jgi:hypothetical protein